MQRKWIPTLVCVLLLLLLWQLLAWYMQSPQLVPSVPQLLKTLAQLFITSTFWRSIGATLLRGLIGMAISFVLAVGVALLFGKRFWVYQLFRPLLTIMRSVPVISFILIALIFLHAESIPLLIAFLTMFPLLTENLTEGIRAQRKMLYVVGHQFGISRRNRFTQLLYPQLKPFLFSGLASASGFGWRAIIMGEVLAQCDLGIGGEMKRAQAFIEVPELLAWTIVAILISYFFDKGILQLQNYNFPVHYSKQRREIPERRSNAISIEHLYYSYESGSDLKSKSGVESESELNFDTKSMMNPGKKSNANVDDRARVTQNDKQNSDYDIQAKGDLNNKNNAVANDDDANAVQSGEQNIDATNQTTTNLNNNQNANDLANVTPSDKQNSDVVNHANADLNNKSNAVAANQTKTKQSSKPNSAIFIDFNYRFEAGTIYGISAPSGKGKTTLLYLIDRLLQPQQGRIEGAASQRTALVFQEPELAAQLSVIENIALPLAAFYPKTEALQIARSLAEEMELNDYLHRRPDELSFGQQHRISIARALAFPASLLLMDEPFKGLDAALAARIIARIGNHQQQEGQLMIFTSHNPEELQQLAQITLLL